GLELRARFDPHVGLADHRARRTLTVRMPAGGDRSDHRGAESGRLDFAWNFDRQPDHVRLDLKPIRGARSPAHDAQHPCAQAQRLEPVNAVAHREGTALEYRTRDFGTAVAE